MVWASVYRRPDTRYLLCLFGVKRFHWKLFGVSDVGVAMNPRVQSVFRIDNLPPPLAFLLL
jgi:hypothetical protein